MSPDQTTPVLTIGDLAERTGLSPATLRMWEQRHGFPEPQRLESGHRRYSEQDVEAVTAVVRHKDAGTRLELAIARAMAAAEPAAPSIYAHLRRRHPHLGVHRLRKSTLVALSWAIEDEFCSKADRASVWGAFQKEKYYRAAEERWVEIARVSQRTTVFADFAEADPDGSPRQVAPARRRADAARVGGGLRRGRPAGRADRLGAAGPVRRARPRAALRVDVDRRGRRPCTRPRGSAPPWPRPPAWGTGRSRSTPGSTGDAAGLRGHRPVQPDGRLRRPDRLPLTHSRVRSSWQRDGSAAGEAAYVVADGLELARARWRCRCSPRRRTASPARATAAATRRPPRRSRRGR